MILGGVNAFRYPIPFLTMHMITFVAFRLCILLPRHRNVYNVIRDRENQEISSMIGVFFYFVLL